MYIHLPSKPTIILFNKVYYDCTYRALTMGILNRTPDSFYDKGSYYNFDLFLKKAESLVRDGADILDVGGVKAGPGDVVLEQEEMDRVVPAVESLHSRFDIPLSVDTWNANVFGEAAKNGAVLGNDISGFADSNYLPTARMYNASVVATHIRLAPRVRDPLPVYENNDVVTAVIKRLQDLGQSALNAGLKPEQIIIDAGLDLGKTTLQSLELLQNQYRLANLGFPLLLSASNKTFLGERLNLDISARKDASLAAAALSIAQGCRIIRCHDVLGTKRIAQTMEFILQKCSEQETVLLD